MQYIHRASSQKDPSLISRWTPNGFPYHSMDSLTLDGLPYPSKDSLTTQWTPLSLDGFPYPSMDSLISQWTPLPSIDSLTLDRFPYHSMDSLTTQWICLDSQHLCSLIPQTCLCRYDHRDTGSQGRGFPCVRAPAVRHGQLQCSC